MSSLMIDVRDGVGVREVRGVCEKLREARERLVGDGDDCSTRFSMPSSSISFKVDDDEVGVGVDVGVPDFEFDLRFDEDMAKDGEGEAVALDPLPNVSSERPSDSPYSISSPPSLSIIKCVGVGVGVRVDDAEGRRGLFV